MVVQWLSLCLPLQGLQVQSPLGELSCTCLIAKKKKKKKQHINNRISILTNSVKSF